MDILDQIRAGKLRCVRTGATLALDGDRLSGGGQSYAMAGGKVPIIFKNEAEARALLEQNPDMEREYRSPSLYQRLRNLLYRDYNSHEFCGILDRVIRRRAPGELVLSIGGGPTRDGENTTNLNIGPFPNVDIVGDAHDLPYGNDTVDAIFCSAVLEHVAEPAQVVREMRRVLKPGGKVLSGVPFMQGYHGYPDHFQNYTLRGHEYLYRSNGFAIISSGACQGPVMAMTTLNSRFLLEYLPPVLNVLIGRSMQLLGVLVRPLDRLLEHHPARHVLASATYVLAEKP